MSMRPYPAAASPTRRGLWVLDLSIRTEKKVFAGALLGSALYGSMTVGAAKKIARSVLVFRVGSPQRAASLAALGATHVSLLAA